VEDAAVGAAAPAATPLSLDDGGRDEDGASKTAAVDTVVRARSATTAHPIPATTRRAELSSGARDLTPATLATKTVNTIPTTAVA
jgi:hypothetical protein